MDCRHFFPSLLLPQFLTGETSGLGSKKNRRILIGDTLRVFLTLSSFWFCLVNAVPVAPSPVLLPLFYVVLLSFLRSFFLFFCLLDVAPVMRAPFCVATFLFGKCPQGPRKKHDVRAYKPGLSCVVLDFLFCFWHAC